MKKSELKSFIKENIIDILSEVSDEELENLEDYSKELDDVIDKQKELGKLQKEASYANQPVNKSRLASDKYKQANTYKKAYDSVAQAGAEKQFDDDVMDKKATKGAKKARGKFKKLDLAVKALKDIETEMKSLARKYSKADETEKEKIKDILREKTPKKKELEQLVAKLEKDVV